MKSPVAAVVVSYRSAESIGACLRSLAGRVEEVVVVDNGDDAETQAIARQTALDVSLIVNSRNRGFAAAVNQGIAATSSPYVLLLNPDCELRGDLHDLVEACRDDRTAAAGGMLVGEDGQPQIGFFARSLPTPWALAFEALGVNRLWKSNPVNRRYRLLDLDPRQARNVDQPAGAFLLIERSALEIVGGMDERFHPVWFEDVDLCARIAKQGYAIRYVPSAVARHAGGHSVNTLLMQAKLRAWYGGFLRFTEKHFPAGTHRRLRSAVIFGLTLRRFYCLLGGGSSAESAAYRKTLRLVRNGFPHDSRDSEAPFSETSAAELS